MTIGCISYTEDVCILFTLTEFCEIIYLLVTVQNYPAFLKHQNRYRRILYIGLFQQQFQTVQNPTELALFLERLLFSTAQIYLSSGRFRTVVGTNLMILIPNTVKVLKTSDISII